MNKKIKTYKILSIVTGITLLLFSLGMIIQLSIYSQNPHIFEFNALMAAYPMAITLAGLIGLYSLIFGCIKIREATAHTVLIINVVFNCILTFPLFALLDNVVHVWRVPNINLPELKWVMIATTLLAFFALFVPLFLGGVKAENKLTEHTAEKIMPKLNLEEMLEGEVITKDEYFMLLNEEDLKAKLPSAESNFINQVNELKQLRNSGVITSEEYAALFKELVSKMK